MTWSFLCVADQSALRRRPVHVPQGCDHPDIQKQGSDSIIGRRVPEKGCTCVGRLVWSTITVMESSYRSLRPPVSSSQKNRPDAPYEGLPPNRWMPRTDAKCPRSPEWGVTLRRSRARDAGYFVCNALKVSAGDDIRIARFDDAMQDAFRLLVLDGMAERWGSVDESSTPISTTLTLTMAMTACSLPSMVRWSSVPASSFFEQRRGRSCGCRSTELPTTWHCKETIGGVASFASEYGVNRIQVETNAKWTEAQNLYEASGFKFTHSAPGHFGRESFYELLI